MFRNVSGAYPLFLVFVFCVFPYLSSFLFSCHSFSLALTSDLPPANSCSSSSPLYVGTLRMRERHKQKERGRELVQLRLYLGCFGVPLQTDLEGTLPMKESKRESARPFNSCFPSFPFYVGTPSHCDCQQS